MKSDKLKEKAKEIVSDIAGMALSNEDKIDLAIERFIPWADKAMNFKNPILEGLSDWVLRKPLKPLIKALLELAHDLNKKKDQDVTE